MKRILARLLLAALALTACSSAPVKSGAPVAGTTAGKNTSAASPVATASNTAKQSAGKSGLHIVGTPKPNCFAMELTYAPQDPVASYVSVTVDVSRGFGSCPELAVGRECFIPLAGSWRLMGPAPGALRVQMFEDDDKTPVRSFMFRGLGPQGTLARFAGFRYAPSKGTKVARFNVGLLDSSGKEMARTLNQFLPLPTCDPRRRS
jgi:hypothetical protein